MSLGKRGLSPIIATVLLIVLGLTLAVIIFMWARVFIGENVQKNGQAVETLCDDIRFRAEAYDDGSGIKLSLANDGTLPLGGVQVKKKEVFGEILQTQEIETGLIAGQTSEFNLQSDFATGDEIIVTPILQGETNSGRKAHVCDEDYSLEITIGG